MLIDMRTKGMKQLSLTFVFSAKENIEKQKGCCERME